MTRRQTSLMQKRRVKAKRPTLSPARAARLKTARRARQRKLAAMRRRVQLRRPNKRRVFLRRRVTNIYPTHKVVLHRDRDRPLDYPIEQTTTKTPESRTVARRWVKAQIVNATRHLERLRPFKREWFGEGLARPREANIKAANDLITRERNRQKKRIQRLVQEGQKALGNPTPRGMGAFTRLKDRVEYGTRQTEGMWYFYDAIFAQRKGVFANELAAMDQIALDCYQSCYMGLGRARSLPTPPPMAYTEPASGPATYRRGVKVPKLSRRANPFPLVRLPFHRMMNPWSLGAVPHEIGHNVHADLKMWTTTPRLIRSKLAAMGMPKSVQDTWAKWHKEIYADLIGVLLIGPYYIESLMDVVGKGTGRVANFRRGAVHPTSYLRPFISTELLRRIGFSKHAEAYDGGWRRLYGPDVPKRLPSDIRSTFSAAKRATVQELCFRPMPAYGGKTLSDVTRFRPQDMATVREAAERLAKGTNPGIAPSRFFIGAAREALDRKLASPETIARNFYTTLTGS